jgi:glucosamine kinase
MNKKPLLFLGVDGGGSRCRVRLRDEAGALRAESVGGSANIYQDFDGGMATILATAREACAKAGVATTDVHAGLGLAGLVTSVGTVKVEQAALPFASVTIENDAFVACIGAFGGGDGGIVIAGTGSIGLARVKGERIMVGGWGFEIGDHGSGAWIGHHAVRRTALSIDGLLQPTGLLEEIASRVGGDRISLTHWAQNATPRDFAQFSPLIFERAAKGDVQAMMIVVEGASAISNLGRALKARGAKRLCMLGGLSNAYPPYLDADVKMALVPPIADAQDGAIMMARKAQGLPELWQ